jgi:hypothetical protein
MCSKWWQERERLGGKDDGGKGSEKAGNHPKGS